MSDQTSHLDKFTADLIKSREHQAAKWRHLFDAVLEMYGELTTAILAADKAGEGVSTTFLHDFQDRLMKAAQESIRIKRDR